MVENAGSGGHTWGMELSATFGREHVASSEPVPTNKAVVVGGRDEETYSCTLKAYGKNNLSFGKLMVNSLRRQHKQIRSSFNGNSLALSCSKKESQSGLARHSQLKNKTFIN